MNPTSKRSTSTPEEAPENRPDTPAQTTPAVVVGPALRVDESPAQVTLSQHLRIDGADYTPGDTIHVSNDYARRLRDNGYVRRT
ncbi:hypothetical protein ACFCZR_24730 [Streptomyces rubiginosohelvolus]|uniref:DUF7210 family protein n=1 Tax=Streptomyces rubiginosohelvolus TaxID=67362 RepID=UPI0035D7E2FA